MVNIETITPYKIRLPKDAQMTVDAEVYTSDKLPLEQTALLQLRNAASLPPARKVLATPDIHQGYGVPIGCVMALENAIMPAAVGYDINCGMRLIRTDLTAKDCDVNTVANSISRHVPLGEGKANLTLTHDQLDAIIHQGLSALPEIADKQNHRIWKAFDNNQLKQDLQRVEKQGSLPVSDTSIPDSARKKGGNQLGTLGGGNHFIEIQDVQTIYESELANHFGIFQNQITIMIHSGSRRFGYEVADHYMHSAAAARKASGPDRQLAYFTANEPDFDRYIAAMNAAGNFAYVNRHLMMFAVRQCYQWIYGPMDMSLIYDVSHNMAQPEHHLGGLHWIHRKGATRSFGPKRMAGSPFEKIGQPVIIPGSMGTGSYLLVGLDHSEEALCSVNHGAGRTMSRTAALGKSSRRSGQMIRPAAISDDEFKRSMKGITLIAENMRTVKEEAPAAYKDIDEVIRVVREAGLALPVARMRPLAVLKG